MEAINNPLPRAAWNLLALCVQADGGPGYDVSRVPFGAVHRLWRQEGWIRRAPNAPGALLYLATARGHRAWVARVAEAV